MAFGSRPSSSRSSSRGAGRGGREAVPEVAAPPADPVEVARQICLHQLEHAPRTRAELAAVLRRKGVGDEVAEQVLSRFAEVGMIDDALFAQMWVTSRHRGRGLAGRALQQELRRKGVEDDVAEQVLSRFAEVGMIDDALFAQLWVTSRHRGKGLAGRALTQELRRKGVADETAAEAVATLGPELELATARSLVERRLRTTAGLPTDARVRRLAGMLARKGYPAGTAFRVVREALAAEGEEAELAFDELAALDDEPAADD